MSNTNTIPARNLQKSYKAIIEAVKTNETPRTTLRFARGISSFTSLRSDGFANKLHPRTTPAVLRLKE